MPPESLFRPEVLENRSHLPFGPIRLARNYSSLVIASILLTLTVAVVVFLFVADFTRKTTVRGHLVPTHGLAVVVSPIRGTLKTILVQEGDHVERGQTLGMVVTEQQTRSGDALKEVESLIEEQQAGVNDQLYAQEKLTARQRAGLLVRIKVLRSELTNAESELSTAVERSLIADKTLHQLRQLAGKGHVSSMQLHAQEEQTLALKSLVQQTKRLTLQIEREISELDQQLDELPSRLETQRAASQRSIAELAQEAAENRVTVERLLKAPISGLVSSMHLHPGQSLLSDQVVMSLTPQNATLEAHLLAPSNAIGFIEVGQTVRLRYHAFPYQKFGHHLGTVLRVSRSGRIQP